MHNLHEAMALWRSNRCILSPGLVGFFFFFKLPCKQSRKKIVGKTPHSLGYMRICIVVAHKYKLVQFCENRVMVVTFICACGHAYSCRAGT